MPVLRREGDVVRLRTIHGLDRAYNRCPICELVMPSGHEPTCRHCGSLYRQVTDTDYQVVRLGPE